MISDLKITLMVSRTQINLMNGMIYLMKRKGLSAIQYDYQSSGLGLLQESENDDAICYCFYDLLLYNLMKNPKTNSIMNKVIPNAQ